MVGSSYHLFNVCKDDYIPIDPCSDEESIENRACITSICVFEGRMEIFISQNTIKNQEKHKNLQRSLQTRKFSIKHSFRV